MEEAIIRGGHRLKGSVKIEGAKNEALPILAASLLYEGVTILNNVPPITDVLDMIQILKALNVDVEFNEKLRRVTVDASKPLADEVKHETASKIRSSVLVIGPLLSRNGRAKVPLPGGCAIGKRPVDLHLKGFEILGAKINETSEYIEALADELIGSTIYLDYPSVGATANIITAAVKAKGITVIENAAREVEIVNLIKFLNKMGAEIHGAATQTIRINGVQKLQSTEYNIGQDRIEAGTFMIAAAMTEGDVLIEDAIIEHNIPLTTKLTQMGVVICKENHGIRVKGPKSIKPVNLITEPCPGFPTDLQAPFTAILMKAEGTSVVIDTVFENRYQHLVEARKMNGDVKIDGNIAVINGNEYMEGAIVEAKDLRGAAALILIGLRAKGVTCVRNLKQLDRGYYNFCEKLQQLGANVERVYVKDGSVI